MPLSGSPVEMLVDLVEIKMAYMTEGAPHDQRAIAKLSKCRQELIAIAREIGGVRAGPHVALRPTRPPTETRLRHCPIKSGRRPEPIPRDRTMR